MKYFSIENGIVDCLLDFYEDSNETSLAIYNRIKSSLLENSLNSANICSFSADNASVNYGRNNSVYVHLQNDNCNLFKANCNNHVVHNAAKYALLKLPTDIKNLVMKIYAHFSISAKKVEELKSCYELSSNYSKLFKHVPTRWLSLFPCLERIINNIDAIISYFIGINSDDLPFAIIDFIWSNGRSENTITVAELHIYFAHHFMTVFHESVLQLENNHNNATHLFTIMDELLGKLENRKLYKFYGQKVKQSLRKFSQIDQENFLKEFEKIYERAIDYLKERFDYSPDSIHRRMRILDLNRDLDYELIMSIAKHFNLPVDYDNIVDECGLLNKLIPLIDKNLSNDKKWGKLLYSNNFPNLLRIVESVLIIPIGNHYVERAFSIMKNIMTDERNLLHVETVKSELSIKLNYSMSCSEFRSYIKDNRKFLQSIRSNKKYINKNVINV